MAPLTVVRLMPAPVSGDDAKGVGINLDTTDLRDADLSHANVAAAGSFSWYSTDLRGTDLRGATFSAGEYHYYYGCVTSSRGGKGSTKWGATFTEMGGAGHPDFKSGEC